MDTNVYSLVQSQRATAVVVTECEWGKTEYARFSSSVFPMCGLTRQNGFVTGKWKKVKIIFRSSLDGAARGAALTLRELLRGLPHHQALVMRSEVDSALDSIKQDMTSSKEPSVMIQHPVLLQELDSILNQLRPVVNENKILSLSDLEEQVKIEFFCV